MSTKWISCGLSWGREGKIMKKAWRNDETTGKVKHKPSSRWWESFQFLNERARAKAIGENLVISWSWWSSKKNWQEFISFLSAQCRNNHETVEWGAAWITCMLLLSGDLVHGRSFIWKKSTPIHSAELWKRKKIEFHKKLSLTTQEKS